MLPPIVLTRKCPCEHQQGKTPKTFVILRTPSIRLLHLVARKAQRAYSVEQPGFCARFTVFDIARALVWHCKEQCAPGSIGEDANKCSRLNICWSRQCISQMGKNDNLDMHSRIYLSRSPKSKAKSKIVVEQCRYARDLVWLNSGV